MSNEPEIEEKPINGLDEKNKKHGKITPFTRRIIVFSLALIAFWSIIGEVALVVLGYQTSEALLSIASVATGALAGGLLPGD